MLDLIAGRSRGSQVQCLLGSQEWSSMRYFQALATPAHFEHWNSGARTSTHASVPGEWVARWNATQSADECDYELTAFGGPFTSSARAAFLAHMRVHGASGIWSEEARIAASELDGLCTFRDAVDALAYGVNSALGAAGRDLYVVISGIERGQCAEEGSVLVGEAQVVAGPLSRQDFQAAYVESATT